MKKTLILSISLFISHAATANNSIEKEICIENGKIRYTFFGKNVVEDSSYCFNEQYNALFSMNCRAKKSTCAALRLKKKKVANKDTYSSFGSPGFKLCSQYKGQGQIIEFFDGAKWHELDRCIFDKDKSYVDMGSLFRLMVK